MSLSRSERYSRREREREIQQKIKSERSRSPIREFEDEKEQDIYFISPIPVIDDSEKNKPIIETPFSMGIEFEPTQSLQYYDHRGIYHYDREVIASKDKVKITIEDFDPDFFLSKRDLTDKEKKVYEENSCKFNIELALGVFEFDKIQKLFERQSRQKIVREVQTNLVYFKEFIEKENQDYLRSRLSYENNFSQNNKLYRNCALTIPLKSEELKEYNKVLYGRPLDISSIDDIQGRTQITIGISYAYLIPLANFYKIGPGSNPDLYSTFIIEDKNEIARILNGFIFSLIYSSYQINTFVSKYAVEKGGSSYLKSTFLLKPRSNHRMSCEYLFRDYPDLEVGLKMFSDKIDEHVNFLKNILSVDELVLEEKNLLDKFDKYRLKVLNNYSKREDENGELKKAILSSKKFKYKCSQDEKTIYQVWHILNFIKDDQRYKTIIYYFTFLYVKIMLYHIFHPKKVVKVDILNKESIELKCKIIDGYLYSYEGKNKKIINKLEQDGIIKVTGIYNFSGDPPELQILPNGKICASFRDELFEWIPSNSNIIVEIRGPGMLTTIGNIRESVKIRSLDLFVNSVLDTLSRIFL